MWKLPEEFYSMQTEMYFDHSHGDIMITSFVFILSTMATYHLICDRNNIANLGISKIIWLYSYSVDDFTERKE